MLLDTNVLLALAWEDHDHHARSREFLGNITGQWATCPYSLCGFIRISSNPHFSARHATPTEAVTLLSKLTQDSRHVFWPDSLDVRESNFTGLVVSGHQQVTDAYLLARSGSKTEVASLCLSTREYPPSPAINHSVRQSFCLDNHDHPPNPKSKTQNRKPGPEVPLRPAAPLRPRRAKTSRPPHFPHLPVPHRRPAQGPRPRQSLRYRSPSSHPFPLAPLQPMATRSAPAPPGPRSSQIPNHHRPHPPPLARASSNHSFTITPLSPKSLRSFARMSSISGKNPGPMSPHTPAACAIVCSPLPKSSPKQSRTFPKTSPSHLNPSAPLRSKTPTSPSRAAPRPCKSSVRKATTGSARLFQTPLDTPSFSPTL